MEQCFVGSAVELIGVFVAFAAECCYSDWLQQGGFVDG